MKKTLKLVSVILTMFTVFSIVATTNVLAASSVSEIKAQISRIYQQCYNSRGSSFSGYCGDYVGWQLYHMGINTSHIGKNGKDTFDYYKNLSQNSGGYKITAYPSSNYSLKSALNTITANGTKNAYNILIGLERGNTSSSYTYGHTAFVHAIIDGICYFSESRGLTINQVYYPEGSVIAVDINYFCNSIYMWGGTGYQPVFEGVIYFGSTGTPRTPVNLGSNFVAHIKKADCGKLLTINSSGSEDGSIVYIKSKESDSSKAQEWKFVRQADGSYRIYTELNGYVMNISNGSKASGTSIDTWKDLGNDSQKWFIYKNGSGYVFFNPYSQKVLDISDNGTADGTPAILWDEHGGTAQTFLIEEVHTHIWNIKISPATCSSDGEELYYCIDKSCTAKETKTIPKLDHTYSNSCDATCNACGEEREVSHVWKEADVAGSMICTVCGATDNTSEPADTDEDSTPTDTKPEDTAPKDTESKDTVSKDTESKDTATKDTESKDTATKDTESKDTATKDTESKDTAPKDTESKDTATKDTESKDTATKDTESKDTVLDAVIGNNDTTATGSGAHVTDTVTDGAKDTANSSDVGDSTPAETTSTPKGTNKEKADKIDSETTGIADSVKGPDESHKDDGNKNSQNNRLSAQQIIIVAVIIVLAVAIAVIVIMAKKLKEIKNHTSKD